MTTTHCPLAGLAEALNDYPEGADLVLDALRALDKPCRRPDPAATAPDARLVTQVVDDVEVDLAEAPWEASQILRDAANRLHYYDRQARRRVIAELGERFGVAQRFIDDATDRT